MVRIITVNVNGIRSAHKKGMFDWLKKQKADVICLQEVRAQDEILQKKSFQLPGYECFYNLATKKGYSGVAIFTKHTPENVETDLGFPLANDEGRYVHIEFNGITIASVYMPSGTSGDARQDLKYQFMDKYYKILLKQLKAGKTCIICGDFNIAHKKEDIKNWRSNQKNSGFLPEERQWLDKLFDKAGYVDAFRVVNQEPDQYTWWSNRGQAYANNVGWRIDYQVVSPDLKDKVLSADIYKGEKFSDHAPLIIDYDLSPF